MIKFKTLRHALMMTAATLGGTIVATVADRPAYAQEAVRTYAIPAQDLDGALREFAMQTGRDVLYSPGIVAGKRSSSVRGQMAERQALAALLAGTGLTFERTASNGYAVSASGRPQSGSAATPVEPEASTLPEIVVTGMRSLNADIRRTEDDVQPYVVFSAEDIERSGVTNLEDFFRTRLPMNTQRRGSGQEGTTVSGNAGAISLRGLSPTQTLILIDGRRVPGIGMAFGQGVAQPNINGIPPSAIERIEVLPSTAGGIYGGSAVGGVINIILKREYSGIDVEATYGNAFDTDVGYTSLALSGGLSLEEGRTRLTFRASRSSQNELQMTDRDFMRRARELNWTYRPEDFLSPVLSYTTNACSFSAGRCGPGSPNLVLDNGTPLNSWLLSVPIGYAGPDSDNGAGLLAGAGRFGFDPAVNRDSLYSAPELEAYSVTVRREFSDRVEGFVDAGFDSLFTVDHQANSHIFLLAGNHPDNPFQQDLAVNVPLPNSIRTFIREVERTHARAGLTARLPGDWTAALEHSWARSVNASSDEGGLYFATPTDYLRSIALRDTNAFPGDLDQLGAASTAGYRGPYETRLVDTILRLSGPVLRLPAGPVVASGYLEHRREDVEASFYESIFPGFSSLRWMAPQSQAIDSAYVEARAPIVAPAMDVPLVREFELFAAVRRDEYETTSGPQASGVTIPSRDAPQPSYTTVTNEVGSTDYTVGMTYTPFEDLKLRASLGTSFLAPNLGQITPFSSPNMSYSIADPQRGGMFVGPLTYIYGGNTELQPEQSESQSIGFIYTPRVVPSLRFSVDYVHIRKTDEISAIPGSIAGLIARESDFPDRVVREPLTPADALLGYTGGRIVSLDLTQINLATTEVEAWDFQLEYEVRTENLGTFRPYLVATHQTQLTRQVLPTDPSLNAVGLMDGPLDWRGNFGVTWELGPWRAGWDVQYYDRHSVCYTFDTAASCEAQIERQGSSEVPSQSYHDLQISYRFDDAGRAWPRALSNTEILLSVQNVFGESPPIIAGTISTYGPGYDLRGDPRLRRFMLTFRRHFGG